jgi:predicted DNA repair protein MutK
MGYQGRLSRRVKRKLSNPTPPQDESGWFRLVLWAGATETRFILAGGIAFALVTLAAEAIGVFANLGVLLHLFATLLVFGVFACIVIVTEESRKYASSGARIRTISGAIAGAAIAVIFSAPAEGVAAAALTGAGLGYLGKYWVYSI